MTRQMVRLLWATFLVVLFVGRAAPALAQNGTMSGKVINESGRDVPEATVTLDFVGEPKRQFKILTDKYGEWYKSGVPPGTWTVSASKETVEKTVKFHRTGTLADVALKPGEKLRVREIAIMTEADRAAGKRAPTTSNLSAAEAEATNKRNAELAGLFKETNDAIAAGNYAEAVAKMTAIATRTEKCGPCYVKIGEIELKRNDTTAAEAAFLKAIEFDPKAPDPYAQLAAMYNGLRRFDEAAKMGTKANELLGATAGGGDAISVFNQGVILWNAGKTEEAQVEFAKAVKMDPKRPSAQYWLGMSTYSLASSGKGSLSDAKGPFTEYLKLAPNGEFAETAKALLATIK